VQARKQRQQRVKELEELSECTFQPALVSHQLVHSGKAIKMSRSMAAPRDALSVRDGNLFDSIGRPLDIHEARSKKTSTAGVCSSAATAFFGSLVLDNFPRMLHVFTPVLSNIRALEECCNLLRFPKFTGETTVPKSMASRRNCAGLASCHGSTLN
jgi:hypothetical protein